jgi:hypothetical protein
MGLNVSELPKGTGAVKGLIAGLQGRYNAETGPLKEQVRNLRGRLPGPKSEKAVPADDGSSVSKEVHGPTRTRGGRGRKFLPADLPHKPFLIYRYLPIRSRDVAATVFYGREGFVRSGICFFGKVKVLP